MTRVTFESAIGNTLTGTNESSIMYWNGVEFTSTPAKVDNYDAVAMWEWLEINAGAVATWPNNYNLKVENI